MRPLLLCLLLCACNPLANVEIEGSEGQPQFHLAYDNELQADLDLHVIDPDGEEISWRNFGSESGGVLETDCKCSSCGSGPQENVAWIDVDGPAGDYTVWVEYYDDCDGFNEPAANYYLRALVGGEVAQEWFGQLGEEKATERWTVAVP